MMLLSRVGDEDNNLILEILIDRSRLLEDSFEYIAHAKAETVIYFTIITI